MLRSISQTKSKPQSADELPNVRFAHDLTEPLLNRTDLRFSKIQSIQIRDRMKQLVHHRQSLHLQGESSIDSDHRGGEHIEITKLPFGERHNFNANILRTNSDSPHFDLSSTFLNRLVFR